jgi:hypothetical protein
MAYRLRQSGGGEMDLLTVGEEAGIIWRYLHDHGKTKLKTLETEQASPELVAMAIGWLAREGKVEMGVEKRSVYIWLKDGTG